MSGEIIKLRTSIGKTKKKKVAWGITGSGDRIIETIDTIKKIKEQHQGDIDIYVYLSKAGRLVLRYYKKLTELNQDFKVYSEIDSNTPFLAGQLQTRKFEFLLIAPATSNTIAKISLGITDTLLTNAAAMALKAFVPVYVMPSDFEEGIVYTQLPNGKFLKLRIRKTDAEHVKKLGGMEDVFVLRNPDDIYDIPW
jgi:archaeoflavoprotein AfpA